MNNIIVNLINHEHFESIQYDENNKRLTVFCKEDSKPFHLFIDDFSEELWKSFKKSEYSKEFLDNEIFKNPKYYLCAWGPRDLQSQHLPNRTKNNDDETKHWCKYKD